MKTRKKVNELRRKFKTCGPYEMASCMGIIILTELLDASINGYFQYFRRNRIIHINNLLEPNERRVVCAHELGHAVLHKGVNTIFMERRTLYIKDRFENEANIFAAELLIPDDLKNTYHNDYNIDQIASFEQLPPELIQLKLRI